MSFKFATHQSVDSIETVPEQFRPFYTEQDGKHVLADNPQVKAAVSSLAALGQSLEASREAEKNAKAAATAKAYEPFAEFGKGPEEILANFNARIEELQGQLKDGKNAKINVEKIKEDLAKAHATELQARDAKVTALTDQLYTLMVTNEAQKALTDAGALDADLAMPHLNKFLKVAEADGKFIVQVVDQAGDLRYSGGTGAPMSIGELVVEMKGNDKYKPLFKSEKPSGGGTPPRPAGQTPASTPSGDGADRSPKDKIAAGLAARSK